VTASQKSVREQTWYALILGAGALLLVLATTLTYEVHEQIALDLPGIDPAVAIFVGIAYWTLFGLLGAFRARHLEAGTVLTFHMPFVVAGTILGGPVVGGWMGLLSQFERREFVDVSWYGLLGNHAIIAIAAVAAGTVGDLSRAAATFIGAEDGVVQFVGAVSIAGVFVLVNYLLVVPVVAIRRGGTLREALRSHDGAFRATVLAEGILAWLMALVYLSVGWWAPIVCVALVLVVWQAHDGAREVMHDAMTGLLNDLGLERHLSRAIAEAGSGLRTHALLVMDLDDFGTFNKQHGMEAGDEVIRAVAGRLRSSTRDTDYVARSHKAGDEFLVLLRDMPDERKAIELAWRIHNQVAGALQLRFKNAVVTVSGSFGLLVLDRSAPRSEEAIREADRRMQHAKRNRTGLWADALPGFEARPEWDQQQPSDPQPHPT
jgi:diguanylate cyclase (GGDEF)-like protein